MCVDFRQTNSPPPTLVLKSRQWNWREYPSTNSANVKSEYPLLCKYQWNTRWAFARKHDIFKRVAMATQWIAPFAGKNCFSEMVWYFIGVYVINRTLHERLEIRNFSSRVENISLVREYFSTLEEKFRISARPCNIIYLCNNLYIS